MSPTQVENKACIEATSLFLMDKNGNMLENDEGMFAAKIVSDGGTRGGGLHS